MSRDEQLEALRGRRAFLIDMDGVVYRGRELLPGVKPFLDWLRRTGRRHLFVTNNSLFTPEQLAARLCRMGVQASPGDFYTSALAAAAFCREQSDAPSAWMIGADGLREALEQAGVRLTDRAPEFVVAGEALDGYGFQSVETALRLVLSGARLIATNADVKGPVEGGGIIPATGAMVAPIEIASGREAYFVGKPNPFMLRQAMSRLGAQPAETVMVGDSMGTDIRGGIEAGTGTALVLSGLTKAEDLAQFAYRPQIVLGGIGELAPL